MLSEADYIEPSFVRDSIIEEDKSCLIIDVRDDDFKGGNLIGCVHFPSQDWPESLDSILDYINERKPVETIIFHCYESSMRGPFCAREFIHYVNRDTEEGGKGAQIREHVKQVRILRGGFKEMKLRYLEQNDPPILENYPE